MRDGDSDGQDGERVCAVRGFVKLGRLPRLILLIAMAIIAITIAALVYVIPHTSNIASAPRSTPSPSATASAATLSCPPTELKLTGVFEECASAIEGQSCPVGSPSPLW